MKKISQLMMLCVTLAVTGYATAGGKNQLTLEAPDYAFNSSVSLALSIQSNWASAMPVDSPVDSIANRAATVQYDAPRFPVSERVRLSFNRAYEQAVTPARVGRFGLAVVVVSDGPAEDYSDGPVYLGYRPAMGGAWLLDYAVNESYRLAFITTYYNYFKGDRKSDSGYNTGLYVGVKF